MTMHYKLGSLNALVKLGVNVFQIPGVTSGALVGAARGAMGAPDERVGRGAISGALLGGTLGGLFHGSGANPIQNEVGSGLGGYLGGMLGAQDAQHRAQKALLKAQAALAAPGQAEALAALGQA